MSAPHADSVLRVLHLLEQEAVPLTTSEIARWCFMSQGQAYRLLHRMQREGDVVRTANGYWWFVQIDGPGGAS